MSQTPFSFSAIIMATLFYTNASMFNSQPQFTIKAVKNKEFDESCLIAEFNISSGNIADCLEHCLKNCRCQSFQICQNTKCQLGSSHKEENSSLLHDKDGCVYAMYEMRHLAETFQKLEGQCSGMNCAMKYNCCRQSDLCPENKTCKPINSQEQPWKRFICECPDGYHGENCDQRIHSCGGYINDPSRKSGMYKVVDSDGSLYEIYCHFDSDGAWTLVQSYSFENGSFSSKFEQFRKPLSQSLPVSENVLTWSGYRLSKPRMESIRNKSNFLLFTCEYEETLDIKKSDYVQIGLSNISDDVLEFKGYSAVTIQKGRGKIGTHDLTRCQIWLYQDTHYFNVVFRDREIPVNPACKRNLYNCTTSGFGFFGKYSGLLQCGRDFHRCAKNDSTTQLWLGMHASTNIGTTASSISDISSGIGLD